MIIWPQSHVGPVVGLWFYTRGLNHELRAHHPRSGSISSDYAAEFGDDDYRLSTPADFIGKVEGRGYTRPQCRGHGSSWKALWFAIVLSTVNVKTGSNKPMIKPITDLFPYIEPIDRTAINAWEDENFVRAVKATGRKKLIMAALWTEILVQPALDARREGYEVFPVVDAVGGTTPETHDAGLKRLIQAGCQPTTWIQLGCELQRDWNREKTAPQFARILLGANSSVSSL